MHKKITAITLKDFKCHSNFSEQISDLTILTGSNGSGKSSVIQGLLIAYIAYNIVNTNKLETNNIYGMNLGLPESIITEDHSNSNISIDLTINSEINEVILGLPPMEYGDLSFNILNKKEINNLKNSENNLNKLDLFYLNAERIGPRIKGDIRQNQNMYVGSKGEYTNFVISKLDKIQKLDEKWSICQNLKISKLSRFSANCEAWLNAIIPGTSLQVEEDLEMNQAKIKFRNKGDAYLPTATGFGITYVLPIIVQALIASMYENPILIVENPEAHLHPFSQSAVGKFLALVSLSGVQVLIETHSEHVINGCRVQLSLAEKCNTMTTLFFNNNSHERIKTLENGELEFWPKGFFDQNRKDLRELLEMRK